MNGPTDAGWLISSYEQGRYQIIRDNLGTWYAEWDGHTGDDIQLRGGDGEILRFGTALAALKAVEVWQRSERPADFFKGGV